MSRIDDISASGSDLLLVVEAQGPIAGVPIVLFSVLLLLQGHRRLPVTAFAIGAAAGYVLAPNLLSMLASVGIDSPLDMAQSQMACAAIIGILMVSVAQASLRMMAGLMAFIGITAGVQALYVRGIDIEQLAHHVIGCHGRCRFNPFRMLPAAEEAIAKYMPPDGHLMANGRLRVLLTRVRLAWMRPLFGPEAVSEFASVAHLRQVLRASCHIPVLGGVLPYQVDHIGTSRARGASKSRPPPPLPLLSTPW